MVTKLSVSVPYAITLLIGGEPADVPETISGELISSTESCIAIGCKPDSEGETEFTFIAPDDQEGASAPIFRGILLTPSKRVELTSVLGHVYLERNVSTEHTIVQIWVNDLEEPDQVQICLAPAARDFAKKNSSSEWE